MLLNVFRDIDNYTPELLAESKHTKIVVVPGSFIQCCSTLGAWAVWTIPSRAALNFLRLWVAVVADERIYLFFFVLSRKNEPPPPF